MSKKYNFKYNFDFQYLNNYSDEIEYKQNKNFLYKICVLYHAIFKKSSE